MDSKIATISYSLLQKHVSRPSERTIKFNGPSPAVDTPTNQAMRVHFGHLHDIKPLLETAKRISSQLGRWCSDAFWTFALNEKKAKKMEAKAERRFTRIEKVIDPEMLDKEIAELEKAHDFVKANIHLLDPESSPDNLSAKVIATMDQLKLEFEKSLKPRCLIFVEERATARLLSLVLQRMNHPNIRPGKLVGSSSQSFDGMHDTFKEQTKILSKFRTGDINCLVWDSTLFHELITLTVNSLPRPWLKRVWTYRIATLSYGMRAQSSLKTF